MARKIEAPEQEVALGRILKAFIAGLGLVAISDVPSTAAPFFVAQLALAGLLFATVVMPVRSAALVFVAVIVAGQDHVSSGVSIDYSTASVWQFAMGPVKPTWLIFCCLFFHLWKSGIVKPPPYLLRAGVWFASIPVATGLVYGGFFSDHAGVEVTTDLKVALVLITAMMLFISVFQKNTHALIQIVEVLLGVLLARHLVDLIYLFRNLGPHIIEGVSRGSEDSGKGAIVLLLYFGTLLLWSGKSRFIGSLIAIISVALLAAYGTRGLWVTSALGAGILVLLIGLKRSAMVLLMGALMTTAGIFMLAIVNPATSEVISARSKDLTEGRPEELFEVVVSYNVISRVDPIRYGQIVNIMDSSARNFSFLWGVGYGGYYEDHAVPFPAHLATAFAAYSFESRKYYRAHDYFLHMYLKYGLIGLIIISALWIIPACRLYLINKVVLRHKNAQPSLILLLSICFIAFVPTAMLQMYWSGKGLMLNAIVISICIELARHKIQGPNLMSRK